MVEGLVLNKIIKRGLLCKRTKEGGFFKEQDKEEGAKGKMPFFLLSPAQNRGGGQGAGAGSRRRPRAWRRPGLRGKARGR